MGDDTIFKFADAVGKMGDRRAQAGGAWPEGTVLVDTDAHWMETDVYYERLPDDLKARAPRLVWEDDIYWVKDPQGKPLYPPEIAKRKTGFLTGIPGYQRAKERLSDMDIEGISKQLLFPEELFGLYFRQEGAVEMRADVFRAYNQGVAAVCAEAPDRLYFVGVPNYFDPSKAKESLDELVELGAAAIMVPTNPRKDVNGDLISFASSKMDPFWSAVEESGLPVCFHIGEGFAKSDEGALATYILGQLQGFRSIWGSLTFGGVFDRHPKLQVVFLEAGIHWVASMLFDADLIYTAFPPIEIKRLNHAPSWYWANHCYATFSVDEVGLRLLDRIGVDRVMWASDYPHSEGTFGFTRDSVQAVFDAMSIEDAQKVLGGTALKVFNMG